MHVTASTLYDMVQCPQRVALDAFGDSTAQDAPNPFVRLLWDRGTLYERDTIASLKLPFTDISKFDPSERERRTLEAMSRGDGIICGGRLAAEDLVGMPDLLRKEVGGYVPGDIKSGAGEEGGGDGTGGKPKIHYAVQLALYIDILERLGMSAGRRAFVWDIHGDEVLYDFTKIQGLKSPTTLWQEYVDVLTEARTILSRSSTPLGAYSAVCKQCHWLTFCAKQLATTDDLTLIPSLGRSIRDTLLPTFATVAALAESNPDVYINGKKTAFKGLGADRLRLFRERAVLLKTPNAKPYLRAPIQLKATPVELFFDVEVDPLRDICYLHGIVARRDGKGEEERFVSFFAETVELQAERKAFADAISYFADLPEATIYYYSKYERTIYRKLQAKYPEVCSADVIERLFDPSRAVDLYNDVVIKATEWPTHDHSIKILAKYLGFTWRDTHPSGAASIEWFDRWVKDGSFERSNAFSTTTKMTAAPQRCCSTAYGCYECPRRQGITAK
jgi:predicted RecB family nuclease